MMYFDPMFMVISLVGAVLVAIPQFWLKSVFAKYNEMPASRGKTGADVAREILRSNQVNDVTVEEVPGELSDHYDPGAKAVRLSTNNYRGHSIAAVAVAAHEVGHAIQHATGYYPVVVRSTLAPVVNIGANLGPILLMIALGLGFTGHMMPEWAYMLAWVGLGLFSLGFLFHLVTLPVEINASMRAIQILSNGYYLSTDEIPGGKKVLTAAAMTYVAVALYSLIQVLYYAWMILGRGNRRD